MKNRTMQEMNEQFRDCQTSSATYEIDGNFYTVTAHFVGEKNLDEIIYRDAFEKAFAETEKPAKNFKKHLPYLDFCAIITLYRIWLL